MFERISDPGLVTTMLCASLILSACGGGGSSSGSSESPDVAAAALEPGLYEAKIDRVGIDGTQTATTYLSPTGKFAVVFGENSGLSLGTFDFANGRISGISVDYRQPDPKSFFEGKDDEEGTIAGTVRSQASAKFSTSDAESKVNTNVTLQQTKEFNALSDLDISLERASGTYQASPDAFLQLSSDGSLYAEHYTQETGCRFEGTESVSVPDASINVFNITYTMSNCNNDNRNGEYSGVGLFGPTTDRRMQMIFAAHNGKVAMKFEGIK
jgi:hypothetical protein